MINNTLYILQVKLRYSRKTEKKDPEKPFQIAVCM